MRTHTRSSHITDIQYATPAAAAGHTTQPERLVEAVVQTSNFGTNFPPELCAMVSSYIAPTHAQAAARAEELIHGLLSHLALPVIPAEIHVDETVVQFHHAAHAAPASPAIDAYKQLMAACPNLRRPARARVSKSRVNPALRRSQITPLRPLARELVQRIMVTILMHPGEAPATLLQPRYQPMRRLLDSIQRQIPHVQRNPAVAAPAAVAAAPVAAPAVQLEESLAQLTIE